MFFAFLPKIPVDGEFSQEHNATEPSVPSHKVPFEALAIRSRADSGVTRKQKGGRYATAAD